MRILDFVNHFARIVLVDAECQKFGVIEKWIALGKEFGNDATRGKNIHGRLQ